MKLLKKSILLSLIAPLLFSLLSFTNALAGEDKAVTIRVYEPPFGGGKPSIVIFTSTDTKNVDMGNNKVNINQVVTSTLEQYFKDGFRIETSNSVSTNNSIITTYILTK